MIEREIKIEKKSFWGLLASVHLNERLNLFHPLRNPVSLKLQHLARGQCSRNKIWEYKKSPLPQDQAVLCYFWKFFGSSWTVGEEGGEERAVSISRSAWCAPPISVSHFPHFASETLSSTAVCLHSLLLGLQIISWQPSYFKLLIYQKIYNWKSTSM